MKLLLELADCADAPLDLVGGKARSLSLAARHGLGVLPGWCLTTEALRHVLRDTGDEGWLERELDRIRLEPIRVEPVLQAIRARLRDIVIGPDIRAALLPAAPLLSRGAIVRSSAPGEDGRLRAYPGIFHSSGPTTSEKELVEEIRTCWLSLFTPMAMLYSRFEPLTNMAILIQPYVEPEWSGVLFSHDPEGGPLGRVELSRGVNHDITAGRGALIHATLDGLERQAIPRDLAAALRRSAALAQEVLGSPVDLEFAWHEGALIVLQLRPITWRPDDRNVWCSQEETDKLFRLDLGRCAPLAARQLQKKVWYRRVCQQKKIETYRLGYCRYGRDLDEQVAGLLTWLRTPTVLVNWGDGSRPARRLELRAELVAELDRQDIEVSCVQVGEIVAATATGYSALLQNGTVRIEAFPMGLSGFKDGRFDASVYEVGMASAIRARPAAFPVRASWNEAALAWVEEATAPWDLELSDAAALAIAHMTRRLADQFGEIRLEWYWDGSHCSVKDLSIESRAMGIATEQVLSPGSTSGKVIRIDEIDRFDEVGRDYEISVFNSEERRSQLLDIPAVAEVRRAAASEDVIVVAEHASVGLIALIGQARGFVFGRGSLLCHTAIALREHGVPAIVSAEGFSGLRDGERVLLTPSGLERLDARS